MDLVEELFRQQPGQPSAKFETVISRSTVIGEAQKLGKTIFQTHPDHKVTDQYRSLAREIEARLDAFHQARNVISNVESRVETHEEHTSNVEVRTNG